MSNVAIVEVLPNPMLPIAVFSSGNPRLYEKDVMVTFTSHDFPVAALVWADAAKALRVLEPFYMLLNSTARNACRRDHFRKGYVRIAADKFHYPVGGFLTTFFLPPCGSPAFHVIILSSSFPSMVSIDVHLPWLMPITSFSVVLCSIRLLKWLASSHRHGRQVRLPSLRRQAANKWSCPNPRHGLRFSPPSAHKMLPASSIGGSRANSAMAGKHRNQDLPPPLRSSL